MRNGVIAKRTKLGLTQVQVAERMGIAQSSYANFEAGKREFSLRKWRQLQEALSIPDREMWGIVNE